MKNLIKNVRYHLLAPMPPTRKTEKVVKDYIRKLRYVIFGRLPFLGRKSARGETSKAKPRRLREGFFERYCQGRGLDIGYGGDPIVPGAQGWDYEHGDAHYLNGLNDAEFDFVYSSHLLEHLPDSEAALRNWWRVLKPGGYLLLYLPHRDLYEKKTTLPSRFNDDHAHFFLPDRDEAPDTVGVLPLLQRVLPGCDVVYCKTCDEGYKNPGDNLPSEGEYSIEVVVRKMA